MLISRVLLAIGISAKGTNKKRNASSEYTVFHFVRELPFALLAILKEIQTIFTIIMEHYFILLNIHLNPSFEWDPPLLK